ncbi:hypothetical protein ACQKP8_26760 [Photobacterium alginatilyticum]|uniref:hypothetical protein n=1 Tax=Photobacterium alginatilyticum TaxID=1775171 RepID=UPI0040682E17
MFKFSEECQKLKTKLLTLSGVCLFIAITGSLPEKIAIIGLDLSQSKNVSGWFILAVSMYFLAKFTILATLEVVRKNLPWLIGIKTRNTQGETLGLTYEECHQELDRCCNEDTDEGLGTLFGELKEIDRKKESIAYSYKTGYVKAYNFWLYSIDFIFPLIFGVFSLHSLYMFLSLAQVLKFT